MKQYFPFFVSLYKSRQDLFADAARNLSRPYIEYLTYSLLRTRTFLRAVDFIELKNGSAAFFLFFKIFSLNQFVISLNKPKQSYGNLRKSFKVF
jgi:hypothetical protein